MQLRHQPLTVIRGILLLAVALTYVINSLFSESLSIILFILVILTFIIAWPGMAVFPKVMSTLLLVFGNVFFLIYGGNFLYWREALLNNIGLVSLFIAVPLLSYPLKNGGYIEYMDTFVNHFLKKDTRVIAFVTMVSCISSSFLNMGSVRMVYDLFLPRLRSLRKIFASSIIQGFALAAFWSPYFAGVAIILHLVGVQFVSFLLYGLIMVVISFIVSIVYNVARLKKEHENSSYSMLAAGHEQQQSIQQVVPFSYKKGIELIVVFFSLFLTLFLLEKWFHYEVLLLISLIGFGFPILWSLVIKKMKAFITSIKDYATNVVPNVHNEAIIIISATFFSQMVQLSNFPDLLTTVFANISQFSVTLTVIIIMVICIGLGCLSHQVLPISVIATTLSPEVLGMTPELLVLALVVSWGLTPLISPISATNLLVGSLFKTKTFDIGRWNVVYVALMIVLSALSITVMNKLTF